jgi:hypothetical protein
MNAVERLLGQGEQVLSLFDDMFIDRLGSGRPVELPDVPPGLIYAVGGRVIDAMPTGQYWASVHWLQAAAEAAWLELKKPKKPPDGQQLVVRTGELFEDYLDKREEMLSSATWRRLMADVVFESPEWGPLAEKVVSLAERVAAAVQQVGQVPGDIEPLDWERRKRTKLRKALDLLHPYSQPPKPATPDSEQKPVGTNPKKRRDRKGVGGRKKKYPMQFVRDVLTARSREEKAFRKSKERLPPKVEWLRIYCRNRGIDTTTMFPSENEVSPEPWDVRANRFWKAAAAQVKRAGN